MRLREYVEKDGLELAALLRRGEVAATELMDCAFARCDEINPTLNAICYENRQAGAELAAHAEIRGAFGALPFLLKDTGVASTSLRGSVGSRLFAGMGSKSDATITRRFSEAGFLPFGRTTVPEFCMAPTTEAVANGGPTRNPWNPELSAGGSSGGAAVAVATGVVPVAHGSDGGGSIRIPASCCGVFGLKPSRGLVPVGPSRGEAWGGLASDGVLSRSVRDTAAAMDAITGMEIGAPYAAPDRPSSYLASLERPFERSLRVACWNSAWDGIEIHADCRKAVDDTARLLERLGHEVIDAPPPDIQFGKFISALTEVMAANVAVAVNGYLRGNPGIDPANVLEPAILDAFDIGRNLGAERYVLALNRFHALGRVLETHVRAYDFVLTPTLCTPPVPLGTFVMDEDFRSFRRRIGSYTTFLAIVNASGQPAVNVPLWRTHEDVPIGIQLIGRFGDEEGLLRLSAQLEAAAPWASKTALL